MRKPKNDEYKLADYSRTTVYGHYTCSNRPAKLISSPSGSRDYVCYTHAIVEHLCILPEGELPRGET